MYFLLRFGDLPWRLEIRQSEFWEFAALGFKSSLTSPVAFAWLALCLGTWCIAETCRMSIAVDISRR